MTEPRAMSPPPAQTREVTLANGMPVSIRPLRSSDREAVAAGFQQLSERSRFLRFLTGKGYLSDSSLRTLVDDVDQHHHVALALVAHRGPDDDVLAGVGRFIALRDTPTTAEVAVTVADELHGLGAGTAVMAALAERAREEGITMFTALMTMDNEASHRMMRRSGTVVRDEEVDGLRQIDVAITGPQSRD